MMNVKLIDEIFSISDKKYGLTLFTDAEVKEIENNIKEENGKYYITSVLNNKTKIAKPEEIVRELWINRLINEYKYSRERINTEYEVIFGSKEGGFADIVIFNVNAQKEITDEPYIIIETKRPDRKDGLKQLKSYCNAHGSPIGVWSNGNEVIYLHRDEPNIFTNLTNIPKESETLDDLLNVPVNIDWLEKVNVLKTGKTTLKKIIEDLEEIVLGNSGVDPFDELFKLIYSKLYDEYMAINDKNYSLQFFTGKKTSNQINTSIKDLFTNAKTQWPGVFDPGEKIKLKPDLLREAVSFLQSVKLFYSNLSIVDEAFEYLIPQASKKKEGQFFTPRPIEDMCVRMLNPKFTEYVIDPACGSGGFLLHSIMYIDQGALDGKPLSERGKSYARDHVYGMDFSEKAIKVSKAVNIIAGDGKTHICYDNSLDYRKYTDETKQILTSRKIGDDFKHLNFDVLLTNPPFAGDVHETEILNGYELSRKNGKLVKKIDRHILFIERSLQMIKLGGRLAIVLPQGIFNNSNAEYIRNYIIEKARILAVVGMHVNTFKPHTGTKTSVLFLKKYTEEQLKKIERLKLNYESEFKSYLNKLNKEFEGIDYSSNIDDIEDEYLSNFIDSYFDEDEDISVLSSEKDSIEDKLNELKSEKGHDIKKMKSYEKQLSKIENEMRSKTKGGKIYLSLIDNKMNEEFKRYYMDSKLVKDMDYKIFFAVNEKPLKDNSGDYIYKKDSDGNILINQNGNPLHDSDLDEISDAFIEFAKKELENGDKAFDFWGD